MTYDASSIEVLEGLEPVRKRPAMYIGTTGPDGLHHLVYEVVDNSIDEALAGYCTGIQVVIDNDSRVTVVDDGRGIPIDMHPTEKRPASEVVMTTLHAGGKFDENTYKVSGGLHGVGISVVNALSVRLDVEIRRVGKIHQQSFARGVPIGPLEIVGETEETGTKVSFLPDPQIFSITEFSFDVLSQRLRELSFLNAGIRIQIRDERTGKSHDFCYEGGINSFVEHLNEKRAPLHEEPIYLSGERSFDDHGRTVNVEVEISLQYNDTYNESVYSFANNINTVEGGTHLIGFRTALTRALQPLHRGDDQGQRGKSAEGRGPERLRRRPARGSHGRHLGQDPAARVRGSDEDQARHERGARHRRRHRLRAADDVPRGEPARREADRREDPRHRPRPRSRPQGPRSRPPQGRALGLQPARASSRTARSATRRTASSSSSRATPPAAPPSRAARGRPRRSCRCAARS